jgi:hypothetical protein
MLLERTTLERHLAEIVASSMPGHGGTVDEPEPEPEPGTERETADGEHESEEQPS